MIRISLIVPTYNRVDYLKESIPSFVKQSVPRDLYEVIVVDNNSTDSTEGTVLAFTQEKKAQLRYIFEPRQGLHYARNRGILEARGDIVVFGDDDIVATETWLEAILNEFDGNSKTGIVGGKVLPIWDDSPPKWIYDYGSEKVHPVFAFLDFGDTRLALADGSLFGCNFAIRRELAIRIGGSYPDTFPSSLKYLSGPGEGSMAENVRELGHETVYLPGALVYHHASASRATLDYFIDRHERWAVEVVFSAFRSSGRLKAALSLTKKAIIKLVYASESSQGKINPEYYRIIQVKSAKQTLFQIVRVLWSRSLYKHINKDNYLY